MDAVEPLRLHPDDGRRRRASRHAVHVAHHAHGGRAGRCRSRSIKGALERLSDEHPFLLSGRYAADRAEVRYWEEATDVATALRMAVLLWDEHIASRPAADVARRRASRCVDRETFHRRGRYIHEQPGLVAAGRVIPF